MFHLFLVFSASDQVLRLADESLKFQGCNPHAYTRGVANIKFRIYKSLQIIEKNFIRTYVSWW